MCINSLSPSFFTQLVVYFILLNIYAKLPVFYSEKIFILFLESCLFTQISQCLSNTNFVKYAYIFFKIKAKRSNELYLLNKVVESLILKVFKGITFLLLIFKEKQLFPIIRINVLIRLFYILQPFFLYQKLISLAT